ncbi:MAG: hypothetical protein IE926_14020 [Micrococcales bacterium]|nr:hypothetical protein [Micrococcales bacterium]
MQDTISPDTITVNGTTYVAEVGLSSTVIVVLQRGWVAVGRIRHDKTSDVAELRDASIIRVWGTTKGLGELRSGPTSKTVLDKAGTIRFHIMTSVLVLDVDENAWAGKL